MLVQVQNLGRVKTLTAFNERKEIAKAFTGATIAMDEKKAYFQDS